jgi:hypothetical protein
LNFEIAVSLYSLFNVPSKPSKGIHLAGWFSDQRRIGLHLMMVFPRLTLVIVLLITRAVCVGQTAFSYPKIIVQGKSVSDFVPAGWEIMDSAVNNYNQKIYTDYAIVIQHIDSASVEIKYEGRLEKIKTKPRILVILFKNKKSGLFKLIDQNNKFILPWNPGSQSDPFSYLKFENDILHIGFSFSYGSGAHEEPEYIFRYDGVRFVLIGFNSSYFNSGTREFRESSYNFLSRKYWINEGPESAEETSKEVWHNIKYKGLRPLSAFNEPYTWVLEKGVSL